MDSLRAVIEEVTAVDVTLVSDDELEAGVAEFNRAVSKLEALIGAMGRRGEAARVTPTPWSGVVDPVVGAPC